MVSEGVPLFNGYGGSEFGNPTQCWDEVPQIELIRNPDWAWMRFSTFVGVELSPQGNDTYELIIHVSNY